MPAGLAIPRRRCPERSRAPARRCPGAPSPRLADAARPRPPATRRRDVGEDVAERVLGQDHVEPLGVLDELQPRRVDEHVLELHVRIVGGDACHRLAPEPRGLEHVRLVHRGEKCAPRPRASSNARRAIRSIASGGTGTCRRRSRREAGRWRRSRGRRRARGRSAGRPGPRGGTQVRVDVESAAEERSSLAPAARMHLRTGQADRAEDDGVSGLAGGQRLGRKRYALVEDRARRRRDAPRSRARAGARGGRRSRPQSPPARFRLRAGDDAQHQLNSSRAPGPTAAAAAPAAVPSWVLFLGGEEGNAPSFERTRLSV